MSERATRSPRRIAPGRPGASRPAVTRRSVAVVALLAGLLAVTGVATPAAAHDSLTGSTPADGSTVDVPPAGVELTFSDPPLALGSEIRVTGPDGRVVNAGDLVLTDTTVSQPLATDLPAGAYAVAWRVTSADGHPISGELTFTAAGSEAPTPTPSGTATQPADPTTPSATPTGEPPAASPGTAEPTTEPTTGPTAGADEDGDSPSSATWVIGIVVALVAAAGVLLALRRRGSDDSGA